MISAIEFIQILLGLSVALAVAEFAYLTYRSYSWSRRVTEELRLTIPRELFDLHKKAALFKASQVAIVVLAAVAPVLDWRGRESGLTLQVSLGIGVPLALIVVNGIRLSLTRRVIRGSAAPAWFYIRAVLGGAASAVVAQALFMGAQIAFAYLEYFAFSFLPWKPMFPAATATALTVLNVALAIWAVMFMAPIAIRLTFKLVPPTDGPTSHRVREVLKRCGLEKAVYLQLERSKMNRHAAFIWNHPFLARWTRPTMVISQEMEDPLSYFHPNAAHPYLRFRQQSLDHVRQRLSNGEPIFQWRDYRTGDLRPRMIPVMSPRPPEMRFQKKSG